MTLETFRNLLYEIRDLSKVGAYYAGNLMDDEIGGPFNFAMYSVIQKNADIILSLFDVIEFCPAEDIIQQRIGEKYMRSNL